MKKRAYREEITKKAMVILAAGAGRGDLAGNIFRPDWMKRMVAKYVGGDTFDLYFKLSSGEYLFTQMQVPLKLLTTHATQHLGEAWPKPSDQTILSFYVTNNKIVVADRDTPEYGHAFRNANFMAPDITGAEKSMDELKKYEYSHQGPALGKIVMKVSPDAIKETENVRAVSPAPAAQPQQHGFNPNPALSSRQVKKKTAKRK